MQQIEVNACHCVHFIYSPPGDVPLANNTVVYINAKCHIPASIKIGPILLNASEVTALTSDPSHVDYEKGLPDFKPPCVIRLSFVDSPVQAPPNRIVTFPMRVSEFVYGRRLESIIMCVQLFPCLFSSLTFSS